MSLHSKATVLAGQEENAQGKRLLSQPVPQMRTTKKRSLMPMPSVTWIELLLGHRLKNETKRLTLNDRKISSGLVDVFRGSGVGSVWIWSFSPNVMQLCHFAAVHCVIVAGVSWPMSSLFHFMLWLRWMHFFWKLKCHGESSFITLNNNKVGLETEDKKKCFY